MRRFNKASSGFKTLVSKSRAFGKSSRGRFSGRAAKARDRTAGVADKTWDKTTEVATDVKEFVVEKAPVVARTLAGSGQAVWDKTAEIAPSAWEATTQAVAMAWAKGKIASKKSVGFVTDHDEELLAAMRVIALKTSDVALFVTEHDAQLLAAVGVVAMNHPHVLAAIAAYQVGKPMIKAIAKALSRLREEGKPEELTDKDWQSMIDLLGSLRRAKALAV